MSKLIYLFYNTVVLNVDRGGISMSKRIFNRVLCIAVLLILTLLLISATLRTIRNPLYTTRTPTWRLRTAVLRTTAQTRATAAQRNGGAVYSHSTLTVDYCNFVNNSAKKGARFSATLWTIWQWAMLKSGTTPQAPTPAVSTAGKAQLLLRPRHQRQDHDHRLQAHKSISVIVQ